MLVFHKFTQPCNKIISKVISFRTAITFVKRAWHSSGGSINVMDWFFLPSEDNCQSCKFAPHLCFHHLLTVGHSDASILNFHPYNLDIFWFVADLSCHRILINVLYIWNCPIIQNFYCFKWLLMFVNVYRCEVSLPYYKVFHNSLTHLHTFWVWILKHTLMLFYIVSVFYLFCLILLFCVCFTVWSFFNFFFTSSDSYTCNLTTLILFYMTVKLCYLLLYDHAIPSHS